jgi:phage gpG-like protein
VIEMGAQIDLRDIDGGFRALTQRSEGPLRRQFFMAAKKPVKEDLAEHQKSRSGPGGAWPGYSPATFRPPKRDAKGRVQKGSGKRKGARRKPSQMLGRLPKAFKSYVSEDHLKLRQMVGWADVHDQGGTAERGARIPARPFAWFSESLANDIMGAWADMVVKGW